MRFGFLACFAVLGGPLSVHAQTAATQMMKSKGWHSSLSAAKAAANAGGKPIMLVFRCDP